MMAKYLTYFRNRKANPRTGREPDENYAREIMQLFTIGLVELNADYDTPREDLETVYAELNSLLNRMGEKAQEYSLKARAICSEEEWSKITKSNAPAFQFRF